LRKGRRPRGTYKKKLIKLIISKIESDVYLAKKVERKNLFPVVFSFDFLYRVFGRSLHEEPQRPKKYFLKSDLKISKKTQKR
jgi:hypothetical protein